MENIIFDLKNEIYRTMMMCQDYLKTVNWGTTLMILVILYILFLRKWTLKKNLSFMLIMALLFVLLVRSEAFLKATFGAEDSNLAIAVGKIIFLIIAAVVLIYNAAIKE